MLEIHFLNVGHGDCTIIRHPTGRLTMLDVNNGQLLDADGISEEASLARAEYRSRLPLSGIGGALGTAAAPNALAGLAWAADGAAGARPRVNGLFGLAIPSTPPSGLASIAALPYRPPPPDTRGGITSLLGMPAAYRSDLVDPIAYLDRFFPNEPIHRYIQTHPDLDHMRGLARLLRSRAVVNFWHPQDAKATPTFRGADDQADWNAYQSVRAGRYPSINVLSPAAGIQGAFWPHERDGLPGGDGIQVLSPTQDLVTWCNSRNESNDISYVVALDYGGRRIVLGGDAEATAWQHMVDRYGQSLSCWVLKASHHGRASGYHGPALDMLAPANVIVSVGKKPDTDAHAKYKRRGADVRSTRRHGTIVLSVLPDGRHGVQYR